MDDRIVSVIIKKCIILSVSISSIKLIEYE